MYTLSPGNKANIRGQAVFSRYLLQCVGSQQLDVSHQKLIIQVLVSHIQPIRRQRSRSAHFL
jgi:hypothetical protein